jgi:integrase
MRRRPDPPVIPPADLSRLTELLEAASWTFAKTQPANPHWYTLRKTWADDAAFCWAVECVRRHGYRQKFNRAYYTQFDLTLDGTKVTVWSMGWPLNYRNGTPCTILLNMKRHGPASPRLVKNGTKETKETKTMPKRRAQLRERAPGVWIYVTDAPSPDGKRHQQQQTFYGTEDEATAAWHKWSAEHATAQHVEPNKLTVIDWLRRWLAQSAKPRGWRPATISLYKTVIDYHVSRSTIASMPLQNLTTLDLEAYLASVPGAASSARVHKAVLHGALGRAVRERLIPTNPCDQLERLRVKKDPTQSARLHCWSKDERAQFLAKVRATEDVQTVAFYALALDSGCRKAELHGIGWQHLDLDAAGTLTVERQLLRAGVTPRYGPTKNGLSRTITLLPDTIAALGAHRQAQAELYLKNKPAFTSGYYVDCGLVFAKEGRDEQRPQDRIGQPIATLGGVRFHRLIVLAGVKRIRFHGCRHCVATLLLQAGVPPVDVASRLGHSVQMLLSTYSHALPAMQQEAAAKLATLLRG